VDQKLPRGSMLTVFPQCGGRCSDFRHTIIQVFICPTPIHQNTPPLCTFGGFAASLRRRTIDGGPARSRGPTQRSASSRNPSTTPPSRPGRTRKVDASETMETMWGHELVQLFIQLSWVYVEQAGTVGGSAIIRKRSALSSDTWNKVLGGG